VVSSDTHIGPFLRDQLRDYCPEKHLDEYDAFLAAHEAKTATAKNFSAVEKGRSYSDDLVTMQRMERNGHAAGHSDMHARLRDMDFEGISAEVVFHGSANTETLPFRKQVFAQEDATAVELELMAVGNRMYNRWLADACSIEPERHVGLAQIPAWDIEASVAEVEWAREAGLRGVNFPPPRVGYVQYNDEAWEPFWAACEALEMPLTTHAGGGTTFKRVGPGATQIYNVEEGGHYSRRSIHFLIFGEVFARHPNLKLVLTEQPGIWWRYLLEELDSVYRRELSTEIWDRLELPSYYFANNVYIGASFMSHAEALAASEDGLTRRFMWGSDYPHPEGTYLMPLDGDELPMSRLALRDAFHGLAVDEVAWLAGETAIECYGLDRVHLRKVAERIGAPSLEELVRPNDLSEPLVAAAIETARRGSSAFRPGRGVWA
jgi:predicted TIM-barrel fold metal-dependent hydrolase